MFETSLDVLYMSLAIGFILLAIFLSIAIFYLIFILRDVSKITERVEKTIDVMSEYVISPVKFLYGLYEKLGPVIEAVLVKFLKRKK